MDLFEFFHLAIDIVCDAWLRVVLGLVVGEVGLLVAWWVFQDLGVAVRLGVVLGLLAWGLLVGLAWVFELPMGAPLPKLTPDYTGFWVRVGVIAYLLYLSGQAPTWLLLWQIGFKAMNHKDHKEHKGNLNQLKTFVFFVCFVVNFLITQRYV